MTLPYRVSAIANRTSNEHLILKHVSNHLATVPYRFNSNLRYASNFLHLNVDIATKQQQVVCDILAVYEVQQMQTNELQ